DATGQKSVSVGKAREIITDYIKAETEKAAGSNQRLSLLEIRTLPQDAIQDLLHLRGKDDLASALPYLELSEDGLYEALHYSDPPWQPAEVVDAGSVRLRGGSVVVEGLSGMRPEWQAPV